MQRFAHPRVVSCYSAHEEDDCLYILMELANGGSLYDKILNAAKDMKPFAEEQILKWFTQIAFALKHVHSKKILHRDVTTRNVFLDGEGNVKLGDFGISRQSEF